MLLYSVQWRYTYQRNDVQPSDKLIWPRVGYSLLTVTDFIRGGLTSCDQEMNPSYVSRLRSIRYYITHNRSWIVCLTNCSVFSHALFCFIVVVCVGSWTSFPLQLWKNNFGGWALPYAILSLQTAFCWQISSTQNEQHSKYTNIGYTHSWAQLTNNVASANR